MTTSSATLRFITTLQQVDFITEALGIQPTNASLAGTPVSSRNPSGAKRTESIWMLDSGLSQESRLDDHIELLCKTIADKFEALKCIRGSIDSADFYNPDFYQLLSD